MEQEKTERKRDLLLHITNAANEVYIALSVIEEMAIEGDKEAVDLYNKLSKCYLSLYELAMERR